MTKEQYTRACNIYERLKLLEEVVLKVEKYDYRLNYTQGSPFGEDLYMLKEGERNVIHSVLQKHEKAILQDIKNEIARLEKEIETI